jgi:hypothetical protein
MNSDTDTMNNKNECMAASPFTMPAALAAADRILGDPEWSSESDDPEQRSWLVSFRRRARLASEISEIRSHATESADLHASWLRSEGWDPQVGWGSGPGDIFLAATLNIVARWHESGRAHAEGGVDRVLLGRGVYTGPAPHGQHPVVEVVTQHPSFSFCFQQIDDAPSSVAELMIRALDMASRSASEEVAVDFPMVDLCVSDDAGYMTGLCSGPNLVTRAAERLVLQLNEIGGRAGAAAEVRVSRSAASATRVIKIDGPFVVAVNRNGAPRDSDKVVFAAYCDRSAWGRPVGGKI